MKRKNGAGATTKKNKKEEHDRDSLNRGSRGRDYGNNNRYR
jgi:hypothetical protein